MLNALRRAFVDIVIDNDEEVDSSKRKHTEIQERSEKDHTLFETKLATIGNLSMVKTAKKTYACGPHIPKLPMYQSTPGTNFPLNRLQSGSVNL